MHFLLPYLYVEFNQRTSDDITEKLFQTNNLSTAPWRAIRR